MGGRPDGRRRFVIILIFCLSGCNLFAQPARKQIEKQLRLLQSRIESFSAPDSADSWSQFSPLVVSSLGRAHRSLTAGRPYAALDDITIAWKQIAGYEAIAGNPQVRSSEDMQAFESAWRRVDGILKEDERRYSEEPSDHSPAVVRALSETAEASVRPMYTASRSYAAITKPADGLIYLGFARGWAELAVFYRSLQYEASGKQRSMHSFLPEIQRLEQRVREAYQPPASVQYGAEFDRVSALLKQARELDAAGLYYGAVLEYLESLRHFGAIEHVPSYANEEDVHAMAVAARARLAHSPYDDSIAQFIIEKAEAEISNPGNKQGSLNAAKQDLEVIVPAYFALVESASAPAVASAHQITVTLVRWPYT